MKGNFISKEKYNNIIKLFYSSLSLVRIAKKINCDERTVRRVFSLEFGKEETKKRCEKTLKLYKKINKKEYCKIENKYPEKYKNIVKLFYTDKSLKKIAEEFNISSATVANIWKRTFGNNEYSKRVKRMRKINVERSSKSLKRACSLGSKNEILCYNLLKEKLKYSVIHHDYNVVPKLETDIIVPEIRLAVNWDGIGHRKPIFGYYELRKTIRNDKIKEEILNKKGWKHISVIDNGSYNPKFVNEKVNTILMLIDQKWIGKKQI